MNKQEYWLGAKVEFVDSEDLLERIKRIKDKMRDLEHEIEELTSFRIEISPTAKDEVYTEEKSNE